MSTEVAAVSETARALTREQRADLAHQPLLTLDDEHGTADQAGVDSAWRAEIGRRADDILSREAELVSGAESRVRVRALLSKLHIQAASDRG